MDGSTPQFQMDEVLGKYIELRDLKDAITQRAKAEAREVEAQMDIIEAWLLNEFNTSGATSIAAANAVAFVKETDFANVQDWNMTLPFIQSNGLWQMLKKDVNKTAVKEFIDAHGVPPPGINWGSKKEVQIRRK